MTDVDITVIHVPSYESLKAENAQLREEVKGLGHLSSLTDRDNAQVSRLTRELAEEQERSNARVRKVWRYEAALREALAYYDAPFQHLDRTLLDYIAGILRRALGEEA